MTYQQWWLQLPIKHQWLVQLGLQQYTEVWSFKLSWCISFAKKCNFYSPCYYHICASYIYAIYTNQFMYIYEESMSIYTPHMNTMQSIMWPGPLVFKCHIYVKYANYLTCINGGWMSMYMYLWTCCREWCGQEQCTRTTTMTPTATPQPSYKHVGCIWPNQPKLRNSICQSGFNSQLHNSRQIIFPDSQISLMLL